MSTSPKTFLTPEQYLEIERKAEFKSEYLQGEMFAMAGAKRGHNRLVGNTFGQFYLQRRQHGCEVYSSDMRVCVSADGLYTYPDIVVVCGEPTFLDEQFDTLLNPTIIIEVLSPSTELYDRGRKFEQYRTIESLREYVLVSSDHVEIELYTRRDDGTWLLRAANRLEDRIGFESVACTLALADVYEGVDFTAL